MRGFSNIGNTCYFNTALQCLLHIPILSNYLIRNPYKGDCEFTQIYNELTHIYWTKGEEMINVETILKAFQKNFPRFKSDQQNDVQEAILCIIDILERAIPEIKKWFYGKKIQETIWSGGKSTNEEDFSVHLVTSDSTDMEEMLKKSVDWDVIQNFEDTEGKVHHLATTRMVFSKLPRVLMISFDSKSHIEIIEKINMSSACFSSAVPPMNHPAPASLEFPVIVPNAVDLNQPSHPAGSFSEKICEATFCAISGVNCKAAKLQRAVSLIFPYTLRSNQDWFLGFCGSRICGTSFD